VLVCAGLSLVSGRDSAAQAPAAFELAIVNVDGTRPVLGQVPPSTYAPRLSPDGRWMAYASNETGRYEVWLEPLPGTGMRYRITKDGGSHPLWRPDGRALYFDRDHQMFSVAVNVNDPASIGEPIALPIKGFAQAEYRRQFDLLSNGREFLMLFPLPVR